MPNPSYDLIAVDGENHYRVTVVPKHGKTVTLYVVQSGEGWKTQTPTFDAKRARYRTNTVIGHYFYVKAVPEITEQNPGYITRHRTKEEAAMAANRRLRRYGRMCSKPLGGKAA